MKRLREFLECSTIHGLIHISTSKSFLIKCFWLLVVVVCFSFCGYLILQSFIDWEKVPIATSEETVSIQEVVFPKITVCPPRGSHTALNHYLEKAKDMKLDNDKKDELVKLAANLVEEKESWEIMNENMQFKEKKKLRNWYEGKSQVQFHFERIRIPPSLIETIETRESGGGPSLVYSNNYRFLSRELSGSIETPWFRTKYDEEIFYSNLEYR